MFYSIAPVLSVSPTQQLVSYGNEPNPFAGIYSGFIDGDNAGISGISGTATYAGGGIAPGSYNIDYVSGLSSIRINRDRFAVADNTRTLAGAGMGVNALLYSWQLDGYMAWPMQGGTPLSEPSSSERRPRLWVQMSGEF